MTKDSQNYYREDFYYYDNFGNRKRKQFRDKSKKNINLKIADFRNQVENNVKEDYTVAEWCYKWLDIYKEEKIIGKSYREYKSRIKNHIIPYIGNILLKDVTQLDLQNVLNKLEGKSKSLITKVNFTIKNIFKKAKINHLIKYNIYDDLELPKYEVEERRILTEKEIYAFIKVALKHVYGLFFLIILSSGSRPQEIRALEKDKINIISNYFFIEKAVEAGSTNIKDPKTKAGIRIAYFADSLKPLILKQMESNNSKYLFLSRRGNVLSETAVNKRWHNLKRSIFEETGERLEGVTPYNLRHTFITKLAEKEVEIKTTQKVAGHSDGQTTINVYTHYSEKMNLKANKQIPQISESLFKI